VRLQGFGKENIMAKLKNLLNEISILGGLVTEKPINVNESMLPQKDIDYIAKMTDYNNHNQARLHLAQVMKNRHLEKAYQAIITLHIMFNQMNELMKARQKLDKMLFTQAKRKYKNFKDIYASY
jgi:hypothetical protein|tara:strand:+ start:425 stop:796 length:372 start_codon:yes stop_codon:yes gene_type:complete